MRFSWRRSQQARPRAAVAAPEPAAAMPSSAPQSRAELVEVMLRSARWALLLRPALAKDLSLDQLHRAFDALREHSACLPAGIVHVDRWQIDAPGSESHCPEYDPIEVETVYLDRYAVTNNQFQAFVEQGGYRQESLWQPDVWPRVIEFVDSTGCQGPRDWIDGQHAADFRQHPVVGINWFEADAYARWLGKRLPTSAEWVKAACSPLETEAEPIQRKYPWSDSFDHGRANLWSSGRGGTAAVDEFAQGDSLEGVRQLIGNVWEWTASGVEVWSHGNKATPSQPLKCIRGGSFDTYFDSQTTCQFQSGDTLLARRHNIGFRCAVSAYDLAPLCEDNAAPELVAEAS